mgnify:CR=1 FL=1
MDTHQNYCTSWPSSRAHHYPVPPLGKFVVNLLPNLAMTNDGVRRIPLGNVVIIAVVVDVNRVIRMDGKKMMRNVMMQVE